MIPASKQGHKWKILILSWISLLLFAWLAVFLPFYSKYILFGFIGYGLWITFLIIFFWKRYRIMVSRFCLQIASLIMLIMSIRWVLLMSSNLRYIIIVILLASYASVFLLPDLSHTKVHRIIIKWFNKHSTKILVAVSIFASAGASIGIFGGRLYGLKVLIIPGTVMGILSIVVARFMQKQDLQ